MVLLLHGLLVSGDDGMGMFDEARGVVVGMGRGSGSERGRGVGIYDRGFGGERIGADGGWEGWR